MNTSRRWAAGRLNSAMTLPPRQSESERNSAVPTMFTLLAVSLAVACSSSDKGDAAASAALQSGQVQESDFTPVLPMGELMTHVLEHSADEVWRRQGWRSTTEGVTSLFPKDDKEWEEAEEAAATLAELTNVLLLPTRKIDDQAWVGFVKALQIAATDTMKAAEAKAEQPFFEAGGQINAACEACHDRYLPKAEKPRNESNVAAALNPRG